MLFPTPQQVFDAEAEARKRHESEQRRQQVQAAYERLFPEPPEIFDPLAEARKRHEAEQRQQQIQAAYAGLYGQTFSQRIGSAFAGTLSGAGAGAFGLAGSAVSAGAAALGPLGLAALAAAGGLHLLNRQANELAARYTEFSPQISQAQAIAELRGTMNDFRRANQLGPSLSNFIRTRTDLEQSWEDFKAKMLESLLPLLQKILEFVTIIVKASNVSINDILRWLGIIANNTDLVNNNVFNQQSPDPRNIFVPEF